jgi:signal transduction histidine kinase
MVVLSAQAKNGSVELHVSDEGPGLPPDFLPRAFERFSRSDEARGRGGTGLGLAIVALIAEAHGGEARISNRNGSGTDAWIVLERA